MDELTIRYHSPSGHRVLRALLRAGWTGLIVFEPRSWLADEKSPSLMVDAGQPNGPAGAVERMRNSYHGEAVIIEYAAALKKAREDARVSLVTMQSVKKADAPNTLNNHTHGSKRRK